MQFCSAELQLDLTDPDMQKHLAAQARATEQELAKVLDQAVTAGELPPRTRSPELARAIHVTVSGSLMLAACYAEPAQARMRADLDLLLATFTRRPRRRRQVRAP